MESFHVKFFRLTDVRLVELLDTPIGVYVIWDGRSQMRPTYIGEGNILSRFESHRLKFVAPIDGYIALLDGDKRKAKKEATMLEALLLHIAHQTDRHPTRNSAGGKWKHLDRLFDRHGVVKFLIDGYDPFVAPRNSRQMQRKKQIRIGITEEDDGDEAFLVEHAWRTLSSSL